MTTVLLEKRQIILPSKVCKQMHLEAGQDFEITIEDEDTITLHRVTNPPNHGLIDHLLACPSPFKVPPRAKDTTRPIAL